MAAANNGVFGLLSAKVLSSLDDRNTFKAIMRSFYREYALLWDCRVDISDRRLGEVYDFWCVDRDRILGGGIRPGSGTLDHFKHASMITFWLRRMVVINDIWWHIPAGETLVSDTLKPGIEGRKPPRGPSPNQAYFAKNGSEICALVAGFYICLAYQAGVDGEESEMKRMAVAAEYAPPLKFLFEYPTLLKHKNISSHSLYMLFHSLFSNVNERFDIAETP